MSLLRGRPDESLLRRALLLLVIVGMTGLLAELALLDHFETWTQWIPTVALGAGLLASVPVTIRASAGAVRVFGLMMILFVAAGLAGIYLHYAGNVEFALERNSQLSGLGLTWKALRGATPALAPAALAQTGLFGLLYCYGHPALALANETQRSFTT